MVMKIGGHVNILNEERLMKFVPDAAFCDEIRKAYVTRNAREFDVKLETMAGVILQSMFTADALIQLVNQHWIKSITRDNVAHFC